MRFKSGIFEVHSWRFSSKSFRRATDISRNSFSWSIPTNERPIKFAAIPVVELPVNGSSTVAPSFVDARIALVTSAIGFCVGCLPQVFSHGKTVKIISSLLFSYIFGKNHDQEIQLFLYLVNVATVDEFYLQYDDS